MILTFYRIIENRASTLPIAADSWSHHFRHEVPYSAPNVLLSSA